MNNDNDNLDKYIRKVFRISLILLFSIAILINLAIFSPLVRSVKRLLLLYLHLLVVFSAEWLFSVIVCLT